MLASLHRAMSSKEFNPQAPPGPWGYDLVDKHFMSASKQLRADSSGVKMLAWLLDEQGSRCSAFCFVGMVACTRLHAGLLSELANAGYPTGGAIFGPCGEAF